MTSICTKPNPVRDEAIALSYLATFDRARFFSGNGNVRHGMERKLRNALTKEAGYTYQEAYDACTAITRPKQR